MFGREPDVLQPLADAVGAVALLLAGIVVAHRRHGRARGNEAKPNRFRASVTFAI